MVAVYNTFNMNKNTLPDDIPSKVIFKFNFYFQNVSNKKHI